MPQSILDPDKNYDAMLKLVEQCATYMAWPEDKLFEIKPAVSNWSIGHHIHHISRAHGTVAKMLARMEAGRMGEEGLEGIPAGLKIVYDGVIPRGRKSPEFAEPAADLNYQKLEKDFGRLQRSVAELKPMLPRLEKITYSFPHIYLGPLNALEWLRFTCVHIQHHVTIMHEIEDA